MTTSFQPSAVVQARWQVLWDAEAAVFSAYWTSDIRTVDTDLRWLAHQCHKELVDGIDPRLAAVQARLRGEQAAAPFTDAFSSVDDLLGELHEEHRHLEAFLGAWQTIAGVDAEPPDVVELRTRWAWPENDALLSLRAEQMQTHGALGGRATLLTEGGGASLYLSGAALSHAAVADRAIAEACALVAADECDHASVGLVGFTEGVPDGTWSLLDELVRAQLVARVAMRNAQFSHPLSAGQLAAVQSLALR